MSHIRCLSLCVCFSLSAIDASQGVAAVILPTLPAGTQYQIVFRTEDTIYGYNSNIATFNNFASNEAAESPGLPATTWRAVISTSAIAANVNALRLEFRCKTRMVNWYAPAGLYGEHLYRVNYDQLGTDWNSSTDSIFIWTGSHDDGTPALPLGSTPSVTAGDGVTYNPGFFWRNLAASPAPTCIRSTHSVRY